VTRANDTILRQRAAVITAVVSFAIALVIAAIVGACWLGGLL
jgi:hypothetical protein